MNVAMTPRHVTTPSYMYMYIQRIEGYHMISHMTSVNNYLTQSQMEKIAAVM